MERQRESGGQESSSSSSAMAELPLVQAQALEPGSSTGGAIEIIHSATNTPQPDAHAADISAALPSSTGQQTAAPLQQVLSGGEGEGDAEDERLEPWLETTSILAHLAFFAILGVIIRYGLEVLFGPTVAGVTDNDQALFLDVPANMFGSFLMGIVGFSLKKDIAGFSEPLAIGLSTGLCGSITTYASWNQRMLAIIAYGLVVRGLAGYLLGTAVAYYAFLVGVDAAEGLKHAAEEYNTKRIKANKAPLSVPRETFMRRWSSLLLFVTLTILLWAGAAVLFTLDGTPKLRKAALGCLVGPPGCWLRWWLSRFNGKGVGKQQQRWKWLPVGTLSANLLAVLLEAAVSAADAIEDTPTGSLVVGGIQCGFLGCLSTVSTLMQEVYILSRAKPSATRAYIYLYGLTFAISLVLGILVYCVPVWVYGVQTNGYNQV